MPHGGSSSSLSLTAGVVEIAEHLPFPYSSGASPAAAAVACSTTADTTSSSGSSNSRVTSSHLLAEDMARVPSVLPSFRHCRWPTPKSAGTGIGKQCTCCCACPGDCTELRSCSMHRCCMPWVGRSWMAAGMFDFNQSRIRHKPCLLSSPAQQATPPHPTYFCRTHKRRGLPPAWAGGQWRSGHLQHPDPAGRPQPGHHLPVSNGRGGGCV